MSVQAMPGTNPHPLRAEVRALLQAAMAVFTFTVVIGILNGTDLVDFDRKRILAHVHGGTLGWITMSVFAASLWLFGQGELTPGMRRAARALTVFAIVALPVFAFTFAFTYGEARPIIGSFALAAIIGFFAWVTIRARGMTLSVVHIGFLAAVATSVAGGVLGVLLATKIATGREVLPDGGADAHPATMVVGFLIPVGMALAEWCFHWEKLKPAGRGGFLQIGLPFLGGMLLMVSLLLDATAIAPLAALLELAGVVIFIKRLWPSFRAVNWAVPSMARYAAAASIGILFNILLLNYLAGRYAGDFDNVPTGNLLALDHTMFIGVLTNAIFGLLFAAVPARLRERTPLAGQAIFFGMNVGLLGFVAGLLFEVTLLKRIFTPIMGVAILASLALHTYWLWEARRATEGIGTVPSPSPLAATD